MSDFKTLKGLFIKHRSSDPSNLIEGEIWYNTTTQTLKVAPTISAWASTPALNTGRHLGAGGGATSNASLMTGGIASGPSATANSEEYDGSSWTEGSNLPTATDGAAFFGIQTAAIAAEGRQPAANAGTQVSYSYDGTSWTATPNTGTASRNAAGGGVQTAGVIFGGYDGPTGVQNKTIEWDGSSWTSGNNMNNPRESHAGAGVSQTAALSMGGNPSPNTAAETYDGTNWTAITSLPVARAEARGATGPSSAALISGSPNITNFWNGSSWSTLSGTLGTARSSNQMSGISTNALLFSGNPLSTATEEYTVATTARSVDTT